MTVQDLPGKFTRAQKKEEPPPKSSDDWAHDPTEEEPDDNEVAPPMIEPEEIQERTVTAQADHDVRFRTNIERKEREEADRQERTSEEKIEMAARIEALQQELTELRQTHLTMQSDTAMKQNELLGKAIREKQIAESQIILMKEDVASVKHLSNVRIKELEERNAVLETQLKETQLELNNTVEKLIESQHTIQDITAMANKEGAQQKLQILDAKHQQDELYKAIHEKEMAVIEEKEKTQALMEKYNGALQRMGEMIRKIEKARTRMSEISAEFDVYLHAEGGMTMKTEDTATKSSVAISMAEGNVKLDPTASSLQHIPARNPEPVEVLGNSLYKIHAQNSHPQKQVDLKPNIWRKIASFF